MCLWLDVMGQGRPGGYPNVESEAILWIYQTVRSVIAFQIMNQAGLLCSGFSLSDCLCGTNLPYVEVHISNLDRREMASKLASDADCVIMGLSTIFSPQTFKVDR